MDSLPASNTAEPISFRSKRSAPILTTLAAVGCMAAALVSGCGGGAAGEDDGAAATSNGSVGSSGGGGAGGAGGAGGGGGCGDTQTDPLNCGFCGHDCRGAACSDGLCEVITFAEDLRGPLDVEVADGNVYWTSLDEVAVSRCPTTGCVGMPEAMTPSSHATMVEVSDDAFYYTDELELAATVSCPLSGCTTPTELWSGRGVVDLAIDATHIYAIRDTSLGDEIVSCPLTGCTGEPTTLVEAFDVIRFTELEVDGSELIYADRRAEAILACSLPDCAGGPRTIMAGQREVSGIVLDGTRMFWTNSLEGTVRYCERASCAGTRVTLAEVQDSPRDLTVAGGWVYWVTAAPSGGVVAGCPIDGCGEGPRTFATGQVLPVAITADDTHIYWADYGAYLPGSNPADGGVFAVPR